MTESHGGSLPPSDTLIRARDLSIGYGDVRVLNELSFDVPRTGVFGLMGPSGAGKSSLLRTLGRWNHGVPAFWATGSVTCDDREILSEGSPAAARKLLPILGQKARLYGLTVIENLVADVVDHDAMVPWQRRALAQAILGPVGLWEEFATLLDTPALSLSMAAHKKLLISRLVSTAPAALLADEPLSDISMAEERALLDFIKAVGRSRAVLIVLHNKQQARDLCDTICLLTGGRIVEVTPAAQFFAEPRTVLGRQFLESGSCWPNGTEEESSSAAAAVEVSREHVSPITSHAHARLPPREFHWIVKDRLAGMQRPGLLGDVDDELTRLAAFGIKVLVSLTEEAFDPARLALFNIDGCTYRFPTWARRRLRLLSTCVGVSRNGWIPGVRWPFIAARGLVGPERYLRPP